MRYLITTSILVAALAVPAAASQNLIRIYAVNETGCLEYIPASRTLQTCEPPSAPPIQRETEAQTLHLDVGTEHEAENIRRAVLLGWSQSSEDDVTITRMAQADGTPFWCIRRAGQEG